MEAYAKFIQWAHTKLTDIEWCCQEYPAGCKSNLNNDQDLDLNCKWNYLYHRYNTLFKGQVNNLLWNHRYSSLSFLLQYLIDKYGVFDISLDEAKIYTIKFRILEIEVPPTAGIWAPNICRQTLHKEP